jgi:hypothetical protein
LLAAGRDRVGEMDLGQRPFFAFDSSRLREHALRDGAWGFDASGEAIPMEITIAE